jgi:hypothetical protein
VAHPHPVQRIAAGGKATVACRYPISKWGRKLGTTGDTPRQGKASQPAVVLTTWANRLCLYSAPRKTQLLFSCTSHNTTQIIQTLILQEACNRREFRNSAISPQFSFKEERKVVLPQFQFTETFLVGLPFAVQVHRRISNSSSPRRYTSRENF